MDPNPRTDREILTVVCRACGVRFEADLQVDRASLESMVVSNPYACPACGAVGRYSKADHIPVLYLDRKPAG